MHIPDGYLSPSTCAVLYASAAPFWYVALKRVRRTLHARTVPLLGLFAAFCFVIMMFNLPLPGGTTGHAVGMGMASIVLGPWVSMLAISIALLIQALFFGDGGLTAFGANSFNMAIVGSLIAYVVYRLIARKAEITAHRRVIAAALAGYLAINAAALCAAIEFGIQPILFHDANGTPLYAPYPLAVAIPAMMIGHLTFAGLAEFVISAGIVSFLQRADPEMLRLTAPDAPVSMRPAQREDGLFQRASRKLWLCLALALILTPLGIVAVGSAWGEWSANDFTSESARREIAAASRDQAPPQQAPAGLKRLSSLWRAPLPQYAPAFIRSAYFGYFVSAAIGVGTIILVTLLFTGLAAKLAFPPPGLKRRRRVFIERTLESFVRAIHETLFAEDTARLPGFLQASDARVKLAGIAGLILCAVAVRKISALLAIFGVAILLALLSRVPLALLARRIWIPVLAFTGVIAIPAVFFVPGRILRIPFLGWPVTQQGVTSAGILVLRAETTGTFALLLVLCTPWNRLLRAFRFFRVPVGVVFLLEVTYRYLFVLLRISQDMLESRRARLVGSLDSPAQRRLASAMVGVLLDKSLQLSGEVYLAMQARGFRGNVHLFDDAGLQGKDWVQLTALVVVSFFLIWMGR